MDAKSQSSPPAGIGRVAHNVAVALALVTTLTVQSCATQDRHSQSPFLLGADVSALASRPEMAARFREDGKNDSEIAILERHGWNTFRLRVFVDPVREAPANSLANTIAVAKEIKSSGALFLLDIHYSDTWADPQHQEIPMAWRSLGVGGM